MGRGNRPKSGLRGCADEAVELPHRITPMLWDLYIRLNRSRAAENIVVVWVISAALAQFTLGAAVGQM
jgi:hypothetical protein